LEYASRRPSTSFSWRIATWQTYVVDLDDTPGVAQLEIDRMANVRQIGLSLLVLVAFVLVVAAPFRWWP